MRALDGRGIRDSPLRRIASRGIHPDFVEAQKLDFAAAAKALARAGPGEATTFVLVIDCVEAVDFCAPQRDFVNAQKQRPDAGLKPGATKSKKRSRVVLLCCKC